MEPKQVTHKMLAKFFTAEFVITCVVVVFGLGVTWSSLNGAVASAQAAAATNTDKLTNQGSILKDQGKALSKIETAVAIIQVQAAEAEKRDVAQSVELREQRTDIKEIIRLLGGVTHNQRGE